MRAVRAVTLVERGFAPGADPRALKLELSVSAANLLNRPQYGPVVGVLTSPFFTRPTSARAPHTLEVGAGLSF